MSVAAFHPTSSVTFPPAACAHRTITHHILTARLRTGGGAPGCFYSGGSPSSPHCMARPVGCCLSWQIHTFVVIHCIAMKCRGGGAGVEGGERVWSRENQVGSSPFGRYQPTTATTCPPQLCRLPYPLASTPFPAAAAPSFSAATPNPPPPPPPPLNSAPDTLVTPPHLCLSWGERSSQRRCDLSYATEKMTRPPLLPAETHVPYHDPALSTPPLVGPV